MEKLEIQDKDIIDFNSIMRMDRERRHTYLNAHEGLTIRKDLFDRVNKYTRENKDRFHAHQ